MPTQQANQTAATAGKPLTLEALNNGDFGAAEFRALPFGEVIDLLREFYAKDAALLKEVKAASAARTGLPLLRLGIAHAVISIRYETDYAKGETSRTFAAFWKETTKSDLPTKGNAGRVTSVSRVFRKCVLEGEHLTEAEFLRCAASWMDDASNIVGKLPRLESGGINWFANDSLDLLNALKMVKGADRVAKDLRQLKNRLNGTQTVAASGKGEVLDAKNAVVLTQRILGSEFNGAAGAGFVMSVLTEHTQAKFKEMPEDRARALFFAAKGMVDEMLAIRPDDIAAWTAPVQTVNTPAPAEPDWTSFTKEYLELASTPADVRELPFEENLNSCRESATAIFNQEGRWITPAELDPLMDEAPEETEARLKRLGLATA